MKKYIIKIVSSCLTALLIFSMVISCSSDDDNTSGGNFNLTELEALLSNAQTLLESTEEGVSAGDQQPGSKATLQSVINWVQGRITSAGSQGIVDDAGVKLTAAIENYRASLVATAFPWVQLSAGAGIQLSDNIKDLYFNEFTVEFQVYLVDLAQLGCCNNLLSSIDPAVKGLGVRYFGNGQVEIYAGNGVGFPEGEAPIGTLVAGEWIDVALSGNGSRTDLYINGQLVATLEDTPVRADAPLTIGNSPSFIDRVSNGLYREFKFWDSVLDASTIQSNIGRTVDGTESGLEAYFPFGSNLGSSFTDVSGDYTATLVGDVVWVSEPPVILLDYAELDGAIQELTTLIPTIEEGDNDGDYPAGTIDFLNGVLTDANTLRADDLATQGALDNTASSIASQISFINNNLVGPAEGVFIDSEDPSSVGLRITPNYNPTGDYTYELDLKLRTFFLPTGGLGIGDIFGNGSVGLRVNGYTGDLTEEKLLNSGGGWNFTNIEGVGFTGPMFPPLTLRSGVWQHVAVVHDDTARTTSIYVDGEMIVQQTDIGAPVPSGFAETWLGNTFGFKITGDIKDFRIWEEARTPSELNIDITGDEPNLITYFPLDRVKGLSFTDDTDSGDFNGEMRGIIWNTEDN